MDALERARQLLNEVTPLKTDCGKLCSAACCCSEEKGETGMMLFPGEEYYYENVDWCRLVPFGSTYLLICSGSCPRDNRPLSCRIFPLVMLPGGKAPLDVRAWPVCPLMPHGRRALCEDFVTRVREAARLLDEEPQHHAFLMELKELLDAYRAPL